MKIYACEEHVEDAVDDFVNETEDFPTLEKCEDKKCNYCNKKSIYIIYK